MVRRGKRKKPKPLRWGPFEREHVVFLEGNPTILPDEVEYYENGIYGVFKRCASVLQPFAEGWPPMWWLSIKSLDRHPRHDWRHLMKIKNELVGEENEAIELYPANSRVVDTSNQYHLFVVKDTQYVFPFGYTEGLVLDSDSDQLTPGAVQRPLKAE